MVRRTMSIVEYGCVRQLAQVTCASVEPGGMLTAKATVTEATLTMS